MTWLQFDGAAPSDRLGEAVVLAGDIDGDGTDDILIGAEYANTLGYLRNGSVYAYSGANGSLLHDFHGNADFQRFGSAIASAGDINHDGYEDILIGSPESNPALLTAAGQIEVYSGFDGSLLLHVDGTVDFGYFGRAVAACDDLNLDGVRDLIVGEPGHGANSGRVHVLSGADGSSIYTLTGAAASSMGFSVACAGDLDLDGMEDFLVGSPDADSLGFTDNGMAECYSGATGLVLQQLHGDANDIHFGHVVHGGQAVDGDTTPDLIVGAPLASPNGIGGAGSAWIYSGATFQILYRIDGFDIADNLGYAAALTGDVNGDGFGDFILGARLRDIGSWTDAGAIWVFNGSDGSLIWRTTGNGNQDNLGRSVGGGRDLDGDGFPEVIFGAPLADPNGVALAGSAQVQRLVPVLSVSAHAVSDAAGSSTVFSMDFPSAEAGRGYILLASATGMGPTQAYGVTLPLSQDSLLRQTRYTPPPVFHQQIGRLDASGDATTTMALSPGLVTSMVGTTLYFAAVSFADSVTPRLVSNARALDILP